MASSFPGRKLARAGERLTGRAWVRTRRAPRVARLEPERPSAVRLAPPRPWVGAPSVPGALSPRGGTRALGSVRHCGIFQFSLKMTAEKDLRAAMGRRIFRQGFRMPRSHHLTAPSQQLEFVTRTLPDHLVSPCETPRALPAPGFSVAGCVSCSGQRGRKARACSHPTHTRKRSRYGRGARALGAPREGGHSGE